MYDPSLVPTVDMNPSHQPRLRVLLLGGTTEASALAKLLAGDHRFAAVLSLAGRTANPAASAIPVRTGGFGGAEGMAGYIARERVSTVIDATHPFAAQISANAIAACTAAQCRLIALERPPWLPQPGDTWETFDSVGCAIAHLPPAPVRVFSGLGRLNVAELESAPQHHYVIRVIDPPLQPLALPHATLIMGRGPFKTEDDIALFREHSIDIVLAKNAGGPAAVSKIEAARTLRLKVMMINRPAIPPRPTLGSVHEVWLELAGHIRQQNFKTLPRSEISPKPRQSREGGDPSN